MADPAAGLALLAAPWVTIEHRPRWWQRRLFGWQPRTIRLEPIRVGHLDALLAVLGAALDGDDAAVLTCLSLSSREPPEVLRRLPAAVLAACVRAFVGLHEDILEPPADEVSRETDSALPPATWADHVATLLAVGHTLAEVRGYTLAQFRAHLGAAARRQSQQQALAIMAARMAWVDHTTAKPIIDRLLGSTPDEQPA